MTNPAVKYASNPTMSVEEARGRAQFGAGCARGMHLGSSIRRLPTQKTTTALPEIPEIGRKVRSASWPGGRKPVAEIAGNAEIARSKWLRPRHDHAMHQSALSIGIVGVGLVHRATIVPDHDVALPPDVAILVIYLRCVADQLVEQPVALVALQPDAPLHAVSVEIERLSPGPP